MRRLPGLIAILVVPVALHAQATADQARLIFSVGVGQASGGGTVWAVNQPIQVFSGVADTFGLSRGFRNSLDVVFSGTYFPGERFGFNIEAQLLGLGTVDRCSLIGTPTDSISPVLCNSISGSTHLATSASLSVGGVFRLASHQPVHPYLRANIGLLASPQSFIKMTGRVPAAVGTADVRIYEDPSPSSLEPYFSLGGGVVAVIGRGYQLRFEVRDNWVRVPGVSGPTTGLSVIPPERTIGRHVLSFTLGFDVVLERKRGRRY